MEISRMKQVFPPAILVLALTGAPLAAQDVYTQHNLVSDVPGMADHTDANLVNAWGMDRSATGPWWINANGTGMALVYDGKGAAAPAASPIMVNVPPSGDASPTGMVFNSSLDFQLVNARQSLFVFVSEDGVISGWNNQFDASKAAVKVVADANYKGTAIAQLNGQNVLYAADFQNASVDMYDAGFTAMFKPAGIFQDSTIPVGYAPFNVQNIDGTIFVTFAKPDEDHHDDVPGPGNGYVDAFTPDGKLIMQLQHGDWMNSPWAVVKAPANFGSLSGRLLVGNFGSGQIATFAADTGKFLGMMTGAGGKPVAIDGLWALKFGNDAAAGPANSLFFTAGIGGEDHGLFGTLTLTQQSGTGK